MSHIRLIVVMLLSIVLVGCESDRARLSRLQMQRKLQLEVVQSFRPPVVDAVSLAAEQPFAGRVRSGRVVVEYPLGMMKLARDVAEHIDGMYAFVREHTSIRWSFGIVVMLVRVDDIPAATVGDRVEAGERNCMVRLFVPVADETLEGLVRANPLFPYSFVHEMTELSLVCPTGERSPLLLDVMMDERRLINYTRWLREGLANYAGELVTREYCQAGDDEIVHDRPYAAMHDAGHLLGGWNEFSNRFQEGRFEKTYYNAALGLVLEIVRRKGEAVLGRILDELGEREIVNGASIDRAVERCVGETPAQIVDSTEVPFLGIEPRDLSPARAKSLGVDAPGGVVVLATRVFSPARDAGLKRDDVIIACNGEPVRSTTRLERILVSSDLEGTAEVAVLRAGRRIELSVLPEERPRLDAHEESLL